MVLLGDGWSEERRSFNPHPRRSLSLRGLGGQRHLSLFSENVIPPGVSVTTRQGEERPRAEGVPSGAGVGVECFCDVAGAVACPPNTPGVSSLLATQLGGDTFTDQLEG